MLTLYKAPIIICIQILQTNLHSFSLNSISTSPMVKGYENWSNCHQRENALIFYQILPTSSLRKYVEISQENLYVVNGT